MSQIADFFEEMAALIRHNEEGGSTFAGAVVIAPPGDGSPIATLVSDLNPTEIEFWSYIKSKVEIRHAEAMAAAAERERGPWR